MKKIMYENCFGNIHYPDHFEKLIEGLSIEEQLAFFRIGCGVYRNQKVDERKANQYDYSCKLDEDKDVKGIIVQDEKIVGVMVSNEYGETSCMVEQGYCVRNDEELDGSGNKSSVFYHYLICVSKDFDGQ